MSTALAQVREDQQVSIRTQNYKNLEALEKKEFRETQLELLKEFLMTKKIEGCSITTIKDYHDRIIKLIDWTTKDVRELSAKDIRDYLYEYQEINKVKQGTLDTMRLILSSFYQFLEDEEYIVKNPVRKIHKIRSEEVVKPAFTDEELEMIRKSAKCIRDLAIIDLLYSSGIRISECVALNIRDMNFNEREFIVYGKGGKERICYFNARTKIEIIDYLQTRDDRDCALFVAKTEPHERLKRGGVRHVLKDIEKKTGIPNIHPHRFRRTLATNLLDKGMPLEQVQRILGHRKVETTLIYANVNQTMSKINHQKYTF